MATVTGTKRHLGITSDTYDSNGDVVVGGNLTVEGTTTTLDTANLLVEDKNIIIGNVTTPSDTTADGGGITLKGASDYTINWVNANNRWEFNQGIYSSGPITSAGQITGTEIEGTSLDINGNADISGTTTLNNTVYFGTTGMITWGSFAGGTGFGIRGESGRALSLGSNGNWDHIVINTSGNATFNQQAFFDAGFDSHPIMLSGAQNFDNIDRSGFYNLYNTQTSSTNSPPFPYGTMIAIGNDKGGSGFGLQIAHERTGTGMYVRGMNDTASAWSAWAEIWTSTTDGAGSGLDADKLDGQHGSYYLDYNNIPNPPAIPTNSTYVDLTSAQTITGAKTFDGAITSNDDATFNSLYVGTDDNTIAIDSNDMLYLMGDSGINLESADGINLKISDVLEITGTAGFSFGNSNSSNISSTNLTANRSFTMPDRNGELAVTSDILTDFVSAANGGTFQDDISVHGNILLTGTATTTNQDRTIDFTGFDKEGTTDFSDRAFIKHTTNTGGHAGSVLVLSSLNDSEDGIAFLTNGSSNLKHNNNTIWTSGNDGAGSGLDADTLDTYSSISFARKAEANPIFTNGLSKQNSRYHDGVVSEYPLGHYTPGETLFEIDPTWSDAELKSYFDNNSVSWDEVANAPGGYAIYINGSVGVGGVYSSGFPLIPIDEDATYYQECWIKNATSATMGHYMGSNDYEADFTHPASGAGNPGSYGYWVMSNTNPGNTWTKVSGYITGHHASNSGAFETDATYFTPLALFNYTTPASGTRACWISGWKIIRVDKVGDRIFQDDVQVKGKLEVHTLDNNTTSATALVMNSNEVEKRTLGSLAFSSATIPTDHGDHDGLYLPIGGGTVTGPLVVDTAGGAEKMTFNNEYNTAPIADTFSGNTSKSYISFGVVAGSNDPGFIMHESSATETNEGVLHLVPSDDNATGDYVSIHGSNDADVIKLHTSGLIETANLQLQIKSGLNAVYINDDLSVANGGTFGGNLGVDGGNLTINGAYPRFNMYSTDAGEDDWSIINNNGIFGIYNNTQASYALSLAETTGDATFSGNLQIPEYLYHAGDTDTNLRFQNNAITLTAGSRRAIDINTAETIVNEASADHNFRVESNNNVNMLFVDGGSDRVGIGIASPQQRLSVDGGNIGLGLGAEVYGIIAPNNINFGLDFIIGDGAASGDTPVMSLKSNGEGPEGVVQIYGSGSTVLDIQGSQGQLFSITDDLSGDLFTVSDISGVPIFNVNATGLATVDGDTIINDKLGVGGVTPTAALHITGPPPTAYSPLIIVERSSPEIEYRDVNTTNNYVQFTEKFNNAAGSTIAYRKVQQNPGGTGIYTVYDTGALSNQGTEYVQKNNSYHWKIDGGTNEVFNIGTVGGNVGVGVTTASQLLHVGGNLRLQNQLYDSTNSQGSTGQVLSKVAAGTAWADLSSLTSSVGGSGTNNTVPLWNGTTGLDNSNITQTSVGAISINETSPANATEFNIKALSSYCSMRMKGATGSGADIAFLDNMTFLAGVAGVPGGSMQFRTSTNIATNGLALTLTSNQDAVFTGNVEIEENLAFKKPTANNQFRGEIVTFGGQGTITVGDIVYLDTSGNWQRAKADSDTTSKSLLGVAMGTTASAGILLRGFVKCTATFTQSLNPGLPFYLSNTVAGDAYGGIPSTTGHIARIVGYSIGSAEMYFCPDNTFVEIA